MGIIRDQVRDVTDRPFGRVTCYEFGRAQPHCRDKEYKRPLSVPILESLHQETSISKVGD